VNALPNRRDDEVRRLLDTPHPAVPIDLVFRAIIRGRRTLRRRRITHAVLLVLLGAAVLTGIVLSVLFWPHDPATHVPTEGSWWSPAVGPQGPGH
jgi:hypothetical protein